MKPTDKKSYMLCAFEDGAEIIHEFRGDVKTIGYGGKYNSISCGYDTEDELRKKSGIPDKPCIICNSPFSTTYNEPCRTNLLKSNMCFSCDFWNNIISKKDKKLIMGGVVYVDSGMVDLSKTGGFIGHGGREFTIEKNDGTIITTNNLWCNGAVPARFKHLLPDNAKSI